MRNKLRADSDRKWKKRDRKTVKERESEPDVA
jgi:hypothetical protein